MKAPERACRLQLDLQADTRDEVVRALEGIATSIDRGEISTGCSGGVHSGWTYEYVERAGPTHEEYHEQLKAYLAAKRAEKETVPAPAACSITEYDGAYRCTTHGRTWGAVTNPDQPCEGCQCDIPVPAMDDKTCARIAELENVLRQARGYLINAAKGRTHWDGCDHPECVILREIDSLMVR